MTVAGAFTKVVGAFVNIATDFISWGLKQVISLLEILVSVVALGVMPYIKKAQAAFTTIIKNPIGFVGNMVRAGKQGFQLFAGNILTHLKTALIKWITGPLGEAGVYIPRSFDLIEIVGGIFGGLSRGIALVGDLAVLGLFAVSITFTILGVSLWLAADGLESKRPWAQGLAFLLGR